MLEPSKPVTLTMRYTPYPAVELQSDEGKVLRPGSVILRHRHLKQQFTIVPSASRQRPRALALARCTYQVVAPTAAVPAIVAPPAVPPAAALPIGAAPDATSFAAPPAAAGSSSGTIAATGSSIVAIPPAASTPAACSLPAADSSVIAPPVAARAGDALSSGVLVVGALSAAGPLVPPVITASEISPAVHGVGSGKGDVVSPIQPLPVQAARRNTSRSHEIVETSNSNVVVRRGRYAIRDKKGKTTWFYSDGQTYLLDPPLVQSAELGDLYVHTTANRDQQIWIFNRNSLWEKIQLYHPHPVLSGYVLHLLSDGEPRWIHKTTVTTYRGREKRYQQMSSRSEAALTSSGQAARLAGIP